MSEIFETVIKNNYCIGCGGCAVISDSYKIELDEYGKYQANFNESKYKKPEELESVVCPFSNNSLNENQISEEVFKNELNIKDDLLGSYNKLFVGHSEKIRQIGASGGLTTWFVLKALETGVIDAVIHLKERKVKGNVIFEYGISYSQEEVLNSAATKYYPGELSNSLKNVIKSDKHLKYAVIGVPCFIKSIRLLQKQNKILKDRITLLIGLVCGHYKSVNYAKMLAWQKGVKYGEIDNINFRYKSGKGKAGDYNTLIKYSENGEEKQINEGVKRFYGTDWGLGMFKYNACDYCDDVVGETADVVFGDAWISPYVNDPMGTNIIISRSEKITKIFQKEIEFENKDLFLKEVSKDEVIKSQSAGFRHRREGLKIRLYWKNKRKEWVPKKRVEPNQMKGLSWRYKMIYKTRLRITEKSHLNFKKALDFGSFDYFLSRMKPIVYFYKYILYGPNRLKIFLLNLKK